VILIATAVVLMASVLVMAAPPASGAPNNPVDPEAGVLLGAYAKPKDGDWTQAGIKRRWNKIEEYAGRTLDVGHYYYKINESFPTWRERWHADNGRVPLVSWANVRTTAITNGTYDSQIIARAKDVKAFGKPILIRWFWEMDGDKNSSDAGTPAQYIAAWRHIVKIFRDRDVDNAQFVWCPNADAFNRGKAEQWYPGDAWVDWLCADGYNWAPGKRNTEWRSLAEIFRVFHDWAAPRNKPMMIGETGVQERHSGEKGQWYRNVVDDLKTELPEIDILLFYDSDTIYNWWVDTSQSAINGFRAMANDPYLNGGTVFSDTFDRGLRFWDHTKNAALDRSTPGTESGAPSLKLAGGAIARADIRPGLDAMCLTSTFKVNALDGNLTLVRFQNKATETIGRVFVNANRELWVRSDHTGRLKKVGFKISRFQWYDMTVCVEKGGSGGWEIEIDGQTQLVWDTRNLGKKIRSFRLGHGPAGDSMVRFDDVTAWVPN
jgi:hypothetical protein